MSRRGTLWANRCAAERLLDSPRRNCTRWLARNSRRSSPPSRIPLTPGERIRLIDEIGADVLGYGPLEPLLDDDDVTEIMVNRTTRSTSSENGRLYESRMPIHQRGATPSGHRAHRVACRPAHRRVVAARRRAARGRLARQRDHPAARRKRLVAHYPEVRAHARTRSTT